MRKKKYTFFAVFIIIASLVCILKVNIAYNKLNGKAYSDDVYKNVFDDASIKKSDVFGEFVINRKKGINVRMYYTSKPFDLRFSFGNKIIYINGKIFGDIKNKAEHLIGYKK